MPSLGHGLCIGSGDVKEWQRVQDFSGGTDHIADRKAQKGHLRVVDGGHHVEMSSGPYRVVAAPKDRPPFVVSAVVAEEDTYLVLSADAVVKEPHDSWDEVIKQVNALQPEAPGSVLIREKHPLEILAIVHDLDREPTWKEEWIAIALDGVFREISARDVRAVAIPLLGTTHGSLALQRAAGLLREALKRVAPKTLERIWLVAPAGSRYRDLQNVKLVLEEWGIGGQDG